MNTNHRAFQLPAQSKVSWTFELKSAFLTQNSSILYRKTHNIKYKSLPSFTSPSAVRNIFSAFTSRCRMPAACIACNPCKIHHFKYKVPRFGYIIPHLCVILIQDSSFNTTSECSHQHELREQLQHLRPADPLTFPFKSSL